MTVWNCALFWCKKLEFEMNFLMSIEKELLEIQFWYTNTFCISTITGTGRIILYGISTTIVIEFHKLLRNVLENFPLFFLSVGFLSKLFNLLWSCVSLLYGRIKCKSSLHVKFFTRRILYCTLLFNTFSCLKENNCVF
jgi:hypothetical protein